MADLNAEAGIGMVKEKKEWNLRDTMRYKR
jgi:hypothetical protein